MGTRQPGAEHGGFSEQVSRDVQRREYRTKVGQLEQQADVTALRYFKDNWKTASDDQRGRAMNTLNNLFQRMELLAGLHGGKIERMDEYPSDLPIPERGHVDIRPETKNQYPWVKQGDQLFVRMEVKGRTYVFFLPNSGSVNVYQNGEYKGGNHDLALFEIDDHLENNGWFGVNIS